MISAALDLDLKWVIGVLIIPLAGMIWKHFLPSHRPKPLISVVTPPQPAVESEPEGWSVFEHFEDGSCPGVFRIENTGSSSIVFREIKIELPQNGVVPQTWLVIEGNNPEARSEPYEIQSNCHCNVWLSLPKNAFTSGAKLLFYFNNRRKPYKISVL